MRRPERRPAPELRERALAGGRRDDRDRQRRVVVERRQQTRDGPRQQRLARPRRPDQQQAVAAGQGDLERPARLRLAADLGQVRDAGRDVERAGARRPPADGSSVGRPGRPAAARRRAVGAAAARGRPRPPRARRRRRRRPRCRSTSRASSAAASADDDPPDAATGERGDHRQEPGHRPDLAAERQLAEQRDRGRSGRTCSEPRRMPDRDREVERRAGLAQVGRRQVDRDPARRIDEAGVAERAADPLARLLERRVGAARRS